MTPWPHQARCGTEVVTAINEGVRRICVQSPTGTGKTYIMGMLAKHFLDREEKVACYTNRKLLLDQTTKSFAGFDLDHGVRAAGHPDERWKGFQICSIQTETTRLKSPERYRGWKIHNAKLVLVDECFTAETEILTPSGHRRIDNMRPGDKVFCATGVGTVVGTSARCVNVTYIIEFANGTQVECTKDHPFFTSRGWEKSQELAVGAITYGPEAVRVLWEDLEAVEENKRRREVGGDERGFLEPTGMLRSVLRQEAQEPHEQKPSTPEDESHDQEASPLSHSARWEWAATSLAAACSIARLGGRLGIRSGNRHRLQPAFSERLSDLLQSRSGQHVKEDRHRGRRANSQHSRKAISGSEKDIAADYARVVRVSRVERACPIAVFNLHVDRHPSYFANGRLVHNCHLNTGAAMQNILTKHVEEGAAIVGFSATPLDVGHCYDRMIIGCTMSEGRACGALVPALVYGPDEPDLKALGIKSGPGEEFSENQQKKAMMTPTIFGRVWDWYQKLNPDMKPSLGFAPGVEESMWFAREFWRRGVSSAHIDGTEVWINGEKQYTSASVRDDIMNDHRDGRIKIIWNRFVMREGIDLKWIEHLILATVYGSLSSYLQSIGRGLRASPATGKKNCIIQDHGGNWHRFGSPNVDREWFLEYNSSIVAGLREEALREHPEKIPVRCPKCALILATRVCPCGYEAVNQRWPRPVVQIDGTMKEMSEQLFRKRAVDTRRGAVDNWVKMYWGWFKSPRVDKSFREMAAFYATQNNWMWPDPSWPYMPIQPIDWFRKIKAVPRERLVPDQKYQR